MVIDWNVILIQVLSSIASVALILGVIVLFYYHSKFKFKRRSVPFCPQCKSVALVAQKKENNQTDFVASLTPSNTYECQECGYLGICPVAAIKDIEKMKKDEK